MAERFFASDHHFSHGNIIKYCNRPFKDIYEMDESIVAWHNELVKPEDHMSFLGDVTIRRGGRVDKEWFCKIIRSMHGHKRVYLGNHDHFPISTYLDAGFEKVYATWRDEGGILFSHIPVHPQSMGSAKANVHGHTHGNKSYEPAHGVDKETKRIWCKPYINISMEVINYRPVNYDTILAMIAKSKDEWEGVKV